MSEPAMFFIYTVNWLQQSIA